MKKIALLLLFVMATPILAQDDPSYADTVEYILGRTDVSTSGGGDGITYRTWISFPSRCQIVVSRTYLKSNGNIDGHFEKQFDLEDIDPSEIDTNKNGVRLLTRERQNSIEEKDLTQGYSSYTDYAYVAVNRQDNIARVARALAHLTRLCGGKEELF